MYHLGIERRARPVEKLKKLYQEFKSRQPSASARVSTTNPSAASKARPSSSAAKPSSSEDPAPPPLPNVAPPTDGYARIKGPVVAGKRREKLRLDLSLLMTDEGIEYSNAEARARSLGLLGKKWASLSVPPPAPQVVPKVPVNSNDGVQKTTTTRRKAMMVGEPTVTINTKEALADVFGMFNSPEKTMRSSQAPGSKHAPVKKVEPVTPVVRVSQTPRAQPQHEKGGLTKTPGT
jgi:checkpoint serine/threonine-protein kinase